VNAQRAKAVHHYDLPMTQKAHAQRSGRAFRQGQHGDVDIHNWHTDTDFDRRALRRLRRKKTLAEAHETPVSLEEHGIAGHYAAAQRERTGHRELPPEMAYAAK